MPEHFFANLSSTTTPPIYKYFDGNSWIESKSGKTIPVHSPIDDHVVGEIQAVTTVEIDEVILRAKKAQVQWEGTPLNQRVKIIHLAADWIRHFEEYLTTLLSWEIGKTLDEAKSEIKRTADLIDYFADEVQSLHGETLDSDNFPGFDKGRIALIERVAHGVIAAIAPFNYPINLSASKIVPAILMGNAVVFKPPTQGAISGLHLSKIFEKAGVPKGVFSCITGTGSEIGDYLVSHSGIDMIAFTGHSDTGFQIACRAAMKPLLFECGGNNPVIVLPDADLVLTAREIVKGAFSYAGQRCTGIKYVLAMPSTLEKLTPQVVKMTSEMVKMGDPRHPETKLVGPVIARAMAAAIQKTIDEAAVSGATIVSGGHHKGAYMEPTIITGAKPTMKVVATEVFGPVVSFVTVLNINEAIKIVNEAPYGLQASIFSRDEGSALVIARQLNVGSVQINGSPQRGPDHFPFLGVKRSGVGVQGVRYSLEAMSRLRPVIINKPE